MSNTGKGIICSILGMVYMIHTFLSLLYMSSSPVARLQILLEEEKAKLYAILLRKLLVRACIFTLMILTCIAILLFFNKHSANYRIEDNLEVLNVVFVVILVIVARLFVSEIFEFRKEIRSTSKKIIRTRVLGKENNKIVLGNKSFSKDEIILDASDFDSLKAGDEVQLELSVKSNIIFSVKKIVQQYL